MTRLRWLAVFGLVVATLVLYRPSYSPNTTANLRGYELFAVADSLTELRGFSDPFMPLPTGPTAHVGPVYPAYLATVFTLFGRGSTAVAVLLWASSLMFALQLAMLPFLCSKLHLGFWTGILAGAGWLAAGILPTVFSEATFTSLLVIAAAYLMGSCWDGELSDKQFLAWTITWAMLLLLQPATAVILVVCVLLLHLRSTRSAPQKLALVLLPILLVAPWIARNFVVLHHLFFIRDNLGIELAVSNRACANELFDVNFRDGCFGASHPNTSYAEAVKVREMGEIEYNRSRMQEAVDWIKTNPGAFATLSMRRFGAFWIPPISLHPNSGVFLRPWVLHCLTLLSVPGLFVMWRKARSSAYVAGMWLLFFPPLYYLIQFMMRYRYPILWATFVPGSYFVVELVRGIIGLEQNDKRTDAALSAGADC